MIQSLEHFEYKKQNLTQKILKSCKKDLKGNFNFFLDSIDIEENNCHSISEIKTYLFYLTVESFACNISLLHKEQQRFYVGSGKENMRYNWATESDHI